MDENEEQQGFFCVSPIACKHLTDHTLVKQSLDINIFDNADLTNLSCQSCADPSENWVCLKCRYIGCSRHVSGHAAEHHTSTAHPIAASFSDHSFWCYDCESYLEHPVLGDFLDVLNTLKFFKEKSGKHNDDSSSRVKNELTTETTSNSSTSTTSTTTTTTTGVQDDESSEEEDEDLRTKKAGLVEAMLKLNVDNNEGTTPKHILDEMTLKGIASYIKSGKAKNIIVLTGAGISVASGIPDFRSPKTGLYHNLAKYNLSHPTDIFDIEFFEENPKPFFTLAKELYPGSYHPTHVHYFIKMMFDNNVLLRNYTQNIDTLERVANVPGDALVEAHGTFATAHCTKCKKEHSCEYVKERVFKDETPLCTECSGVVKPDIVFFGESLPARFGQMVKQDFPLCDLLIVIGTSLQVQPFASLVSLAPKGIPKCLINMEVVGAGPYGAFRFDDEDNTTDVKWIGDCQQGVIELAEHLGWKDKLNELHSKL
ncbi:hypothetical protein SAMD00019534_118090 [Acytostelium subglobosum LB1]|uniref:hypothetical protein n=1 Tax=Acytostelium subglobosum LB1 TaxID=1410327 RepID=UPI0006449734|nr:hypothetical protein SAMD00019534_118090 [Acytostelium subglobosum LB1]GAM28633.1 hypothetical protein SAMD00019534_118090 [Acytostelium subglobosum LB1]|eukprot:XP_012748411.1 hypothetical protein SAMD00019534_118090 [Acytostelium subglobosum LB1]